MSEIVMYEVGVVGITMFSTITILAIISMYGGTTFNVKLAFGFMAIMGLLELPRYIMLTIYKFTNCIYISFRIISFLFLMYCCNIIIIR